MKKNKGLSNLRLLMAAQRISQAELAEKAGLARSTITSKMGRRSPFNAAQMERVARALNIAEEDYNFYFCEVGNNGSEKI